MSERTILITGVTGKQGGATARALQGKEFHLRGLTRRPHSDEARALRNLGIDIVEGDLNDEASLRRALTGAWGVYAVQNTWEAGVDGEEVQGHRIARLAHDAHVQHFVYASVGSAHRKTGIPHFDNKFRVEETVRSLGFPSYTIIRPVFFMENLVSPWFLNGDAICAAMKPTTVLQMIAVDDIGQYGALAFTDARLKNRELDIAGDAVTMPEAARVLGAAMGKPLSFVEVPLADVRKNSEDLAIMLEWFGDVGYDADIEKHAAEFGVTPTSLVAWAARLKG
ncbi:MAG: NmrA/HSCARG family protein [Acidobacteriota bacterium]